MIKIDIDTRCWQIPKEECFLGVESDDKVKILQFELSKNEFCDGLNFTDCNCFINYKNEGNDTIPYAITDMEVKEDGTVTFTWKVSRGATIFKGNTFAILCAKKISEDGTITNEWNSRIGTFTVSKGLEPLSSITEVPEIDIISQLLLVAQQTNVNAQTNIDKSSSLLEKAEGLGYLKEEYDVLESRMNQFTSLKEGATTGDAELIDGRIGYDGKVYDNIGGAIREQVSELKSDIDDLILKEYYSNRVDENKTESGYYLSLTGLQVSDDNYSTTDYVDITGLSTIYLILNTKHPQWRNNVFYSLYDEQKTFIKRGSYASTGSAIDATNEFSGKSFVRLSYITAENSKVYVGDKTEYEPYGLKEKIIQPSNETVKARGNFDTLKYRLDDVDRRLVPNINTVLYFGDSLTQGNQDGTRVSRDSVMSTLLGNKWNVINYGVGGEQSHTISARASGSWFYLDAGITIPSDGSTVDVTTKIHDEYGTQQNFGNGLYSSAYNGWDSVNPCYVNGIECTLQKANASAPITIKRNTIGDAIVINRPTRIHMNSETFKKNPVLILCLGQNEGFNRDADILIQQIKGIIEFFKSERYIVIGMPHSLSGYTWEAPINEALKKEFGKHYLDIEGYMKTPIYDADGETIISSYALSDAGLTTTEDDLIKISNNQYPTSIMFDGVHFNHYGYEIWANVEYKLGKDLGYWD